MSSGDESTDKDVLKLDPQSLEAIIEGVAAKLRPAKPGEHSGAGKTVSTEGDGGESQTTQHRVPLHQIWCEN